MEYYFKTRLKGSIVLTPSFHQNTMLQKDKTLYKFIWVQKGKLALEVDHIPLVLEENEILPLTPLHHIS